jgi:hypothetical protein
VARGSCIKWPYKVDKYTIAFEKLVEKFAAWLFNICDCPSAHQLAATSWMKLNCNDMDIKHDKSSTYIYIYIHIMVMTMKKEEKCPLYEIVETVQATANASEFWLAAELVS